MIAVILNHTYNIVFTNQMLLLHTIFSVTMFVFVGGITAAISIDRQAEVKPIYLMRRITGILVPYLFAALAYHVYVYKGHFSYVLFYQQLIGFSYPAMYYIAFFIQLVLISTFLFKLIKAKYNSPIILLIIGLIYLLSFYFTNYTKIADIGLAGANILGGTYLFVFSMGILFFFWMPKLSNIKAGSVIFSLSVIGLLIFEYKDYILSSWANPPKTLTMIYTLLVFGIVFGMFNIIKSKLHYIQGFLNVFNYIGKNSLYIYLYHFLFITISTQHNVVKYFGISSNWLNAIWVLSCAIVPPLLIAFVTNRYIRPNYKKLFFYNNSK
ncbi:Acyltransferase family protein [compost metagenome]